MTVRIHDFENTCQFSHGVSICLVQTEAHTCRRRELATCDHYYFMARIQCRELPTCMNAPATTIDGLSPRHCLDRSAYGSSASMVTRHQDLQVAGLVNRLGPLQVLLVLLENCQLLHSIHAYLQKGHNAQIHKANNGAFEKIAQRGFIRACMFCMY